MSQENFKMVAKTFQGLEDVLRDELIDLGALNVELGNRMVSFEGDRAMLYKANLCCRTALRILKPIVMFTADSTDELYDLVREMPWEQYLEPSSTFSIDSTVYGDEFNHSKFVTYRVKDAIVDHFRDINGSRPSIRVDGADLIFNVHIAGNRVTISLDSSGEPLYKRGYRVAQTQAPINEVLAAGIILKTGWKGDSDFIDPMCGSGTFLIEAALIAANINPGIYRESFAFEKWKDFDKDLFEEIYNDDSGEREFIYKIKGSDIDADAVAITEKNIKAAHVEEMVEVSRMPLSDCRPDSSEGILVTNPPYGERLKTDNIEMLYKEIGYVLKNYFQGWHAWIIGYNDSPLKNIGLKPSVKLPLFNGRLECCLQEFVLFDGSYSTFKADGGSVESYASERKKSEAPRKVRHISEDEWKKESRRYSFGQRDKKSRDRYKGERHRKASFERNDSDKKDFNKPRDEKRFFESRDKKRSFEDRDRNRSFEGRDKKRSFEGRDGRRQREEDLRMRKNASGVNYNPANSKGPRLPQSSETVINAVHIRKRKNKKTPEIESGPQD